MNVNLNSNSTINCGYSLGFRLPNRNRVVNIMGSTCANALDEVIPTLNHIDYSHIKKIKISILKGNPDNQKGFLVKVIPQAKSAFKRFLGLYDKKTVLEKVVSVPNEGIQEQEISKQLNDAIVKMTNEIRSSRF